MSMKYLGPSLDIHAGGVDNIFPHHENEIAQSETYTGKRFVKYWLHAEHLLVEGEKMAKSKGNFYTLRDLIKRGYDPRAIRFCLASSYYRRPLNFTLNGLEAADSSIQRIEDCRSRVLSIEPTSKEEVILEDIHDAKDRFIGGMDDDLNSPRALSSLFEMIRDVNRHLDSGASISLVEKEAILDLIGSANGVFDFLSSGEEDLPERVMQLIDEREEARAKKDYQRADVLREEIARNGFILEDTPRGVRWKRISSL
jgi:cysteinyl-tRNA synthetase